jgi:hypothetical protein
MSFSTTSSSPGKKVMTATKSSNYENRPGLNVRLRTPFRLESRGYVQFLRLAFAEAASRRQANYLTVGGTRRRYHCRWTSYHFLGNLLILGPSHFAVFQSRPLLSFRFFPSHPVLEEIFRRRSPQPLLDPPDEFTPCKKPIEGLTSLLHAFYLKTCRDMSEINASGGLIHLLPSRAGGPNEFFFDVFLMDTQGLHSFLKPPILFFAHGKKNHVRSSSQN